MHETYCADVFKHKIIEKYFDTVYRLAYSQTQDRHKADDVLQEVFLRYIKSDKAFESEEHIKAWLIRVTVNCCKSIYLSSWFKKTVPLNEEQNLTFEIPEQSDVYMTVAKLPKKYKTVIHLFYYEDLSVKQIADYLKIKESTVKSQLHRGREMLKSMLKEGSCYEF